MGTVTTAQATHIAGAMRSDAERLANTYFAAVSRTLVCTSTAVEVAPLVRSEDLTFPYVGGTGATLRTHGACLRSWTSTSRRTGDRKSVSGPSIVLQRIADSCSNWQPPPDISP
jgi:hypothetical protein